MELQLGAAEEAFREEARTWLEENLTGEFKDLRGRGGPGDEHMFVEERMAWERRLASGGWTCVGWAKEHGGRGASFLEQVVWFEEYARARGPGRAGHIGETLLGPTVAALGTDAQRQRFLPPIVAGTEYWCQGYSEPGAGSDLANVQTKAELDGDEWVITGQKVWTSLAQWSDWCFVIARTEPGSKRHKGLSYLLVPMDAAGIDVRPIRQITGTCEFNEVFFDETRTHKTNVVGEVGGGWRVAMATLGFERGASTLGQQLSFQAEFEEVVAVAKKTGASKDPVVRQRIADLWVRLTIMRQNTVRLLAQMQRDGSLGREAMISKLYWATWHRDLGEVAMDVLGEDAEIVGETDGYGLDALQRLFLFSRSDTIYAGTNEIQKSIIAERALGLPRSR